MGATCLKILHLEENNVEMVIKSDSSRDFQLKKYKSPYDSYFNHFEENINLLKYLNIINFVSSLTSFKFDSNEATQKTNSITSNMKSSVFTECINQQQLMLFIENKIIKHNIIYDLAIDPELTEVYSEFLLKLYETVRKGYLSYVKIHNSQNDSQLDKKPKKYFLLAKGILFCGGDILAKLDIIFSTFKNEANKLEKNNTPLHLFIFLIFLMASYGIFKNIDDLSPLHPNYFKLTNNEEEKNRIYEKFDLQRIIILKDNFINRFFSNASSLSYFEFREKVMRDGHDWFLSSQGIRMQLANINSEDK